eukprot:1184705-Prorocentrum_minimum.AAC.6
MQHDIPMIIRLACITAVFMMLSIKICRKLSNDHLLEGWLLEGSRGMALTAIPVGSPWRWGNFIRTSRRLDFGRFYSVGVREHSPLTHK